MVNAVESSERQDFNREIWAKTVEAVGDQFAPTGFHSRPGLAYMSWSRDTGGLLLPPTSREAQEQRDDTRNWTRWLKPVEESALHLSTPVPKYRFPESEKFNSGPGGLLASLNFFKIPRDIETGEGPTAYSWLLQQKDKIKNIAILGALNARPVNAYYAFLKENSFNCNLHVIDVSPIPLAQTQVYMELGYMNDSSVRVVVHPRTNILSLTDRRQRGGINLPDCDLAISDILSRYIYPDEEHPDLLPIYYQNINDLLAKGFAGEGGYLLTREQVRLGESNIDIPTGILATAGKDINAILTILGEPTLDDEALMEFRQNLYPPFLHTSQPDVFKGPASKLFDRINGVHIVVPKLSAAYTTEIMHAKP